MAESGAIRAGRAFIEIFADDAKLQRTLRSVQARMTSWGNSINSIGLKLFAVGGAAKAALGFAVGTFSEMGFQAEMVSRRTGLAVEQVSALGYMASQTGSDMESLETAIKRLQRNLVDAALGSKEAVIQFARMGVSAQAIEKSNIFDVLEGLANKFSGLKNANERAAEAMHLFGRSGTAILPLLEEGAAGIQRMRREAEEFGLIVSGKDAAAATLLHQRLDLLWQSVKMAAFHIGSALNPELIDLATQLAHGAKGVADFVRENKGLVISVSKIAGIVAGAGAGLIVLGTSLKLLAPSFAIARLGMSAFVAVARPGFAILIRSIRLLSTSVVALGHVIITTMVKSIAAGMASLVHGIASVVSTFLAMSTPIAVLALGLAALAGAFVYFSGVLGKALSEAKGFFAALKQDSAIAIDAIRAALMNGDVASAARVLWATLVLEWERGKAALNAIWLEAKIFFLEVWQDAVSRVAEWMINVTQTIKTAWKSTIGYIADLWGGLLDKVLPVKMRNLIEVPKPREPNDEWKDELKALKTANAAAMAAYAKMKADALAASKKSVDDALADLKAKAAAAKAVPATGALARRGGGGADDLTSGSSVAGTLNPLAVRGLAGPSTKLNEIAANTAATVQQLKKWGAGAALAGGLNAVAGGAARLGQPGFPIPVNPVAPGKLPAGALKGWKQKGGPDWEQDPATGLWHPPPVKKDQEPLQLPFGPVPGAGGVGPQAALQKLEQNTADTVQQLRALIGIIKKSPTPGEGAPALTFA